MFGRRCTDMNSLLQRGDPVKFSSNNIWNLLSPIYTNTPPKGFSARNLGYKTFSMHDKSCKFIV